MMKTQNLRTGLFRLRTGLVWAAVVLVPTAAAWGAPPPPTLGGESQAKSYVYQYMLVGLCIALGMVLLCRPRKRAEDVERTKDL
jgi:hypothetical protein